VIFAVKVLVAWFVVSAIAGAIYAMCGLNYTDKHEIN
jgi:hypothetical protein